jgi:hypothetical protein
VNYSARKIGLFPTEAQDPKKFSINALNYSLQYEEKG